MKTILCLCCCVVLFSCVSEVDIDLSSENETELTLNCLLTPADDTIVAWLSYSKSILTSQSFEGIEGAEINLYENDSFAGSFIQSDTTAWFLPYKTKSGDLYKIVAITENDSVWGKTIMPNEKEINFTSSVVCNTSRLENIVSFIDNPNEENYYWISAKGCRFYSENYYFIKVTSLYSDYSYADDFNREIEDFMNYAYCYNDYIRIFDEALPNDTVDVQFTTNLSGRYNENIDSLEVFVLSTDYNLDKYMKASWMEEDNDSWAEDFPIAYSPSAVYSNVNGGVGIVGSYISVSKVFSIE